MNDLKPVAILVRQKRGTKSIRMAAKEIGISPTTLSKVERGYIPDAATMRVITEWIGCKLCAIPPTHRVVSVELLEEWQKILTAEGFNSLADEMCAIIDNKGE